MNTTNKIDTTITTILSNIMTVISFLPSHRGRHDDLLQMINSDLASFGKNIVSYVEASTIIYISM